ncbi:hypothetical protein [Branchiibius sp. NY16-3462-2]|uniref:hypothetical protein n=1 Tax=Branchiibius sp. NY16-3462-2 TaxID=1807500 RepID=UPI000799D100|nr:hypothetical protein [Branchiibius sp. NY16-3462-2]KYH43358.1 hypothetical protein AZH51_16465 [Branchiibius sp. NY16-3462-2]
MQAELAGRSSQDVVRDVSTRATVLRELAANACDLPEGEERRALLLAAGGLYDADRSIAWSVVNTEVAQALGCEPVAIWWAEVIPPGSTNPPSANDAEVRELVAETFADLIIADLSADERRAIVLRQAELDPPRVDRWIDMLVEEVWHGETSPAVPTQVRSILRSDLLQRLARR